jgi:hypothetical protein
MRKLPCRRSEIARSRFVSAGSAQAILVLIIAPHDQAIILDFKASADAVAGIEHRKPAFIEIQLHRQVRAHEQGIDTPPFAVHGALQAPVMGCKRTCVNHRCGRHDGCSWCFAAV